MTDKEKIEQLKEENKILRYNMSQTCQGVDCILSHKEGYSSVDDVMRELEEISNRFKAIDNKELEG